MNPDYINPIIQLLIALLAQYPQIASGSVQEVIDHKGEWTPEQAAAFTARMKARFASPDWTPEVTP